MSDELKKRGGGKHFAVEMEHCFDCKWQFTMKIEPRYGTRASLSTLFTCCIAYYMLRIQSQLSISGTLSTDNYMAKEKN